MEPLHYDDLPKNIAECWELLGTANHPDAVKGFLQCGAERNEEDLLKFKKTVLKLSGVADLPKFFDGWPVERQVGKAVALLSKEKMKEFKDNLVRYWLLGHHRTLICNTLDAAGIPHTNGYIEDDYNAATKEMWQQGLATLWVRDELPVRIYLGYILIGTRKSEQPSLWQTLALALGKGSQRSVPPSAPTASLTVSQDPSTMEIVDQLKAAQAEESGEFLLYEREIIKALARGAISRTDALAAEDAVEMARQLIDDAPGRARVFFLLGFAQALHRLKPDLGGIAGLSQERGWWFFAGHLHGLARYADSKAIVAFLKESLEDYQEFLKSPGHPVFEQTYGIIAHALAEAEEAQLFSALLVAGQEEFSDFGKFQLLLVGETMARELSSRRKYGETLMLTSALRDLAQELITADLPEFGRLPALMLKNVKRREAIATLGKRDLAGARSKFGQLAAEGSSREKVEMRAWIAMANAELTDFFDVFPSSTKEVFSKSGERMQAVVREISAQGMESGQLSPTVSTCAGVAKYCQGHFAEAHGHFQKAADAIMQEGRSPTSRAYLWVRFMRSSAQLMSMDTSASEVLLADFDAIAGSKIKPSSWFYAELVESAALFPDQRLLGIVLAAVPAEDGEKHFRAYQNADILPQDSQKRVAYAQWLPGSKRRKEDIFEQLSQVVRWDLRAGKTEAAELAMDTLEQLADEAVVFAEGLLSLVAEARVVPDLLDETTQVELRIRLLLRLGREVDVLQLMQERFRKAATAKDAWQREQALALFSELKDAGADLAHLGATIARLTAEFGATNQNNDIIIGAGPLRVIYVGGTEVQQAYEKDIVAELAVEYPNLEVHFIYPGWSSNWAPVADGIKARLGNYNGLVLSYFVRTIFGRTIRKMCTDTCPWWAAPGHGKASIKRGILAAARHAAGKKTPPAQNSSPSPE